MDVERHPSGITFDVRRSYSALPSVTHHAEESQFHGIPVAGEQHQRYLPLLEVSQDVKVIAVTSRTLLAQTFVNSSSVVIQEANYCFPLYDGSVIISFRYWLDGKPLLEGKVKPKAVAKAEYKNAVARRRVAALLEEHTPEIFETVVGNIPPQTIVKVEITYVNELKADKGGDGMLVTIPTSIAPRYGTPPTGYRSPSTVDNGLKIKIEVAALAPIQKLESRTHPISVELGSEGHPTTTERFGNLAARGFDPKKARASLSDRTAVLGKDFILLIVTSSSQSHPRALIEFHPSLPDHSVIMTTIIPREIFAKHLSYTATRAEIIFVADRSGSMLDKMEALINALRVLLEKIPEQCLFNICSFGSQNSLLWPRSRLSTPTNRDHAHEHLMASFRADLGGTELLPALKTVVQQRITEEDQRTEVILLTDGEVWNTEATIDFVRTSRTSANGKIRFFALGIGNAVSHRLVEGIGSQGGGYAEVVTVDAHGQWESRVLRMLNGALTSASWQCKISLEPETEPQLAQIKGDTKSDFDELLDGKVQKPVCVQAPFHIPTLHAFSRHSVFFIVDRKMSLETSIRIQAVASTGETVTVSLAMEKNEEKPATIHFLAAQALMNDFETKQSWLHSKYDMFRNQHPIAFEEIVRQEAESVGKEWSITSKWTSFVAVDHGNKLENVISHYKAERSSFSELGASLSSLVKDHSHSSDLQHKCVPLERARCLPPISFSELGASLSSLVKDHSHSSDLQPVSDKCVPLERARCLPPSSFSELGASLSSLVKDHSHSSDLQPVSDECVPLERARCSSPYPIFAESLTGSTGDGVSPRKRPRSMLETAERILTTLIDDDQTSLGSFPLRCTSEREIVLESFRPGLLSVFEDALQQNQEVREVDFLFETITVAVYFEKKFPNSFQIWDSAVKKAHDWVLENVKDESVREKLFSLVRENFQEASAQVLTRTTGRKRRRV